MAKLRYAWKQMKLSLAFAIIVFVIIIMPTFFSFFGMMLSMKLGLIERPAPGPRHMPMFLFVVISLMCGVIIAVIFNQFAIKPIRKFMAATDKIADGDYTVRLDIRGLDEFRRLSCKFNHMAEELQSVEMLRSDFVNNFSHEFKTPIVSIRGFAKALKWEDLTNEERTEYLNIIIAESERLSELSTNVLNLSKLEQQTILTDKKNFNLTEQIRLVIAMLDGKWAAKNIYFQFDCEEFYINGNEELMKQVWINLIDNAIKFSPDNELVTINITQSRNELRVSVENRGECIPPEKAERIFDKFYQCDPSHSTKGNGLGLALVKEITELHNGTVSLLPYTKGSIVFEVSLPI